MKKIRLLVIVLIITVFLVSCGTQKILLFNPSEKGGEIYQGLRVDKKELNKEQEMLFNSFLRIVQVNDSIDKRCVFEPGYIVKTKDTTYVFSYKNCSKMIKISNINDFKKAKTINISNSVGLFEFLEKLEK